MNDLRRRSRPSGLKRGFGASGLFCTLSVYAVALLALGGAEVDWNVRGLALTLVSALCAMTAIRFGGFESWSRLSVLSRIALCLVALVPLIQIVPLPPAIWHALPGGEIRKQAFGLVDLANSWQPLTLAPIASLYTAIMATTLVVMIVSLCSLTAHEFSRIGFVILGSIALMVLLGVAQVASAGDYPEFYRISDRGSLIGTFANKNHMALMIVASIPLAHFVFDVGRHGRDWHRIAFIAYWVIAMVALPLTNSRAGLLVGLLASAAVGVSLLTRLGWRMKLGLVCGAAILGVIVLASPLPAALLERFGDVPDDLRWTMYARTLTIIPDYWLSGSGFGSFAPLYMTYEKLDWLTPLYVNNAHNDFLQLVLEGGVPAVLALVAVAVAVARALVLRRRSDDPMWRHAAWTGGLILLMFVLHSVVDYPLRRPAAAVLFAFALACVLRVDRPDAPLEQVRGDRVGA